MGNLLLDARQSKRVSEPSDTYMGGGRFDPDPTPQDPPPQDPTGLGHPCTSNPARAVETARTGNAAAAAG